MLKYKLSLITIILEFFCVTVHAQTVIQMETDGGVYKVPCKVNGLKLKFIFDTGASSVSISSSVANMMLENDYLSKSDVRGGGASILADGSIVDHTKINLREIEIGGLLLHNVEAVVIHNQDSPLLLGLTAIRKLGKISLSGNTLSIESQNQSMGSSSKYSNDELFEMYQNAFNYYHNGSIMLAVENFDILYNNDYLLPYDLSSYANCLAGVKRHQEALDIYLGIIEWTRLNEPNNLGNLYGSICDEAYWAGQYRTSIRYGELVFSTLNVLDKDYYFSSYWVAQSYKEMGDIYAAKSTLDNYLKKYMKAHDISPTDCWSKNYKDSNIAETYRSIGYLYETYAEGKKYVIIAAAWGDQKAIEECNQFLWSYTSKPYEYVY